MYELKRISKVRRLIVHLLNRAGVPAGIDLTDASLVPLWMVQRSRYGQTNAPGYGIWRPEDRHPDVPWAVPPCPFRCGREEAIEILRELWIPDALRWVREVDPGPAKP